MAKLAVTFQNQVVVLSAEETPFFIGRNGDNALVVPVDFVSGRHGQVVFTGGCFVFEDLDSSNGSFHKIAKSLDQFKKISKIPLSGKDAVVVRLGGNTGPEISFELMQADRTPADDRKMTFESGRSFLKSKDFKTAYALFEQFIYGHPEDLAAYYYAGFAAAKCRNLEGAILRFEQYLMLRPRDTHVMLDLGKIYERAGRLEKAVQWYRVLLALQPENQEATARMREIDRFNPSMAADRQNKKTHEIIGDEIVSMVSMPPFSVTYNVARHGRIINDVLKNLKSAQENVGRYIRPAFKQQISVHILRADGEVAGKAGKDGIFLILDTDQMGELPFLSVLVTHEYAHFALGVATDFSPHIPWWFHEGFAQMVSQKLTPHRLSTVSALAEGKKMIPLSVLEKMPGDVTDKILLEAAYLEAHTALVYMATVHGEKKMAKFVTQLARSGDRAKAFEKLGTTASGFENEWVEWLCENTAAGIVHQTKKLEL